MAKQPYILVASRPIGDFSWKKQSSGYFSATITEDHGKLKEQLRTLYPQCRDESLCLGMRPANWNPRAAFFDMDATLLQEETLDCLAEEFTGKRITDEITELAMAGKMDFAASIFHRLDLIKGCPISLVDQLVGKLNFQPFVKETIARLNELKISCFLVSGGFTSIAAPISKKLNMTAFHANIFELDEDKRLTGKLGNRVIVDGKEKLIWIRKICNEFKLNINDVMAVGDGANDRWMLDAVGLGMGYQPKTVLFEVVDGVNFSGDHRFLLELIEAKA